MKIVQRINTFSQYQQCHDVDQVLCGVAGFSFRGKCSIGEYKKLSKELDVIFDWDLLLTQKKFENLTEQFEKIASFIKTVRVVDFGVISYLFDKHPHIKIQLNLETKGRNLQELLVWQDYLGDRLDRFVLANELSASYLEKYVEELSHPVEILGLGPLRLAYTPRKLFSKETITISSEESLHKNYPIFQNDCGTQMYHIQDISLLSNVSDLKDMGVSYFGIDIPEGTSVYDVTSAIQGGKEISDYPRPVTRGFFKSNRSDILFEKLSNKNIKRDDSNYIGDILEVNKGNYLALMIRSKDIIIKPGKKIKLLTPDGKIKYGEVHTLRNSSLCDLNEASCDQLVLINPIKGISIRTAVYEDTE